MALRIGRSLLRVRLKKNGMTQREFAEIMDVWESVVSMWISRERTMTLEQALYAAIVLRCKVEDLQEIEIIPPIHRKGH